MSDNEMDKEWSFSRLNRTRPQSTVAKAFSDDLDNLFKIDQPSIADLDAEVCEKKEAVRTHTNELEALEARLRAAEERLKDNGVAIPIKPVKEPEPEPEISAPGPVRPSSAKKEGLSMPGALPPTPGASDEDEQAGAEQDDEGESEEEDFEEESEDEERPGTADIARRRKRAQSLGRRLLLGNSGTKA